MRQYKKIWAILTLLCFALTFLPVAAFAAIDFQQCSVFTDDTSSKTEENIAIQLDFDGQLRNNQATTVYVWFVKDSSSVPTLAVKSKNNFPQDTIGVFTIPANKVAEGVEYNFNFENTGKYTVAAALENPNDVPGTTAEKIKNVEKKIGFFE